jgi:predicted NBD/HSP70 family sugar kinase
VGVGGGIVIDGQLARGATGSSGEVGHMTMVRDGLPCGCGSRGCWETLVGLHAVLAQAVPDLAAGLIADPALSPEDKVAVVAGRASAGDSVALHGLREVGRWLGLGLANLVNVVNPDTIVLAGALRDLGEWLVPEAACVMAEHTVAPAARDVRIVLSTIDFPAASRGGAILAAERVFEDPTAAPLLVATS